MKLTDDQVRNFQDRICEYYRQHGRPFPWRDVTDPYDIWVSEVMLQQTQADRVVPKYQEFVTRFPEVETLAGAKLSTVLGQWSGLGYNRRAIALHKGAGYVMDSYGGVLPESIEELVTIPSIGPYTARAIRTFAANEPHAFIETNIRSVFIHEFCGDREDVTDSELMPLIEQTIVMENPREWYAALMDYGTMLKKSGINPSRRSKHHVRQSKFEGSRRQLRGLIVRNMLEGHRRRAELLALLPDKSAELDGIIDQLINEGFLVARGATIKLAD